METAQGALREGVMYDLLGRIQRREVRGGSIDSLRARYHVDAGQAERVRETADRLRQAVAVTWGLGDSESRRLLRWAAELHEIGLDISHAQYHKHGAYVVRHADLAGFSQQEQALLAVLVQGHRRRLPHKRIKSLPPRQQKQAYRLLVLLRLAVLLHRSRDVGPQSLPRLEVEGKRVTLRFAPSWLAEHPLLVADLQEEAKQLATAGFRLYY
ncbi:hypothetical protein [Alkalilimnicola ehrlichii]|uniref:hypothetical protein n=1 Tax=Alkalilimnicola ehrlichii TaxID=351052 RepID=UPI00269EA08C